MQDRNTTIKIRVAIFLAITGWAAAAALFTAAGEYRHRITLVEAQAADWQRKAGKAYTEMLKNKMGPDSKALLVPAGVTVHCRMERGSISGSDSSRMVNNCEDGFIYPPAGY